MKKRKIILAMQMTLDGYIAGPNDEMDWIISSDDEWTEMFKDLKTVDTFLLGRKMYPGYADYWRSMLSPSSPPDFRKYAQLAEQTPHIVFTKTNFKPDWKNTSVASDLGETIKRLQKEEGKDIVAWGGGTLATSLINEGLVDEYRITLNPNLLGGGKLLFSDLHGRRLLKLIDTRPLRAGTIVLRYKSGE
jgi:dihydrofolate reductase